MTFKTMDQVKREHFIRVLLAHAGNRTDTARVLDISLRSVRNLIREYGLPRLEKGWPRKPRRRKATKDGTGSKDGPLSRGQVR